MNAKKVKKLNPVQRFRRLLLQEKKALANLYVFALFAAVVSLSLPLGIQAIVNLIVSGQVTTSFYVLIAMVVIGYGINGYLQILQITVTEVLQRKVFARAAFDFAYRAPRFNLAFIQHFHAPELMNRFFDTLTVQKGIPKILIDFVGSSLQIFIGLILLCFYHPFFILFGFLTVILVFFIVRILSPQGMSTALRQSKYKYEVVHWLEELARTIDAFKLAGTSPFPLKEADDKTTDYLMAREAHFRSLMLHYSSILLFKVLIAGAFLLLGGLLVIDQQMNIGQFIASEIIVIILLTNAEKLIFSMDAIYDMLTALEKLGSVTDIPLERTGGLDTPKLHNGGLELEVINLEYQTDKRRSLLQGVSFSVASGQRVLLTGYSGSGKHTLLQLLNGLYENFEGIIKYNGISIRSLDLLHLRDKIGDTMARDSIFKGSFLENLTMGNLVPIEEVLHVVQITRLQHFLDTLPLGLNTELIPEGKLLSRNIKSKILVARCLIKKPELIMLDENVEYIREGDKEAILNYIYDRKQPWTVISVNYSINKPDVFDKIIYLGDGKVLDEGSYDDVKSRPWFKELFKNRISC
jgi:ABC-type bacteriocin/lantibiotic exporter with double-glycine peptidase domain